MLFSSAFSTILCMLRLCSSFGELAMKHIIRFTILCLIGCMSASADDPTMTKRELAETRLMAEWAGDAQQQYKLAEAYYKGKGVQQDYAEALKWFRLAADQGLVESQHMLGVMYDQGTGTTQDYTRAVAWYQKAAEQGYAPAGYDLGRKFASGEGVPQNFSEAYVWFSLAATAGFEPARQQRDIYAGKLSQQDINQAQKRASQLFEAFKQTED